MEHSELDILWVIIASALVFLMQAGFAMVESGMTRSKNSINVAVKNLTDFGVSSVLFWLLGFGIMFGTSFGGFIGTSHFAPETDTPWLMVFLLFQTMFASTAATIVSGAVAERMRYGAYICSTILISLLVYPVFGHWAWGGFLDGPGTGWLFKLGFVDFAGSTVVHALGGWFSLAAILVIGPRTGKYDKGTIQTIPGSNIPIAVLGVLLLWFGWFGFNGGSTLALNEAVGPIIFRTSLAGATGMMAALAFGWPLFKKPDVNLVLNGSLAGLVAITASVHAVSNFEAAIIGALGGLAMVLAGMVLDRLKVDDAVGAIPVHLAAGITGTIAVGIFGDPVILGTGHSTLHQIGIQVLGSLICGLWAFGSAFLGLKAITTFMPLRVTKEEEFQGLNKAEHGVTTEIHDLYRVLDQQAATGDMDIRAPIEPFTEVGQIATMYNNVLDKLQDGSVAKTDYLQILENVTEGMFLLERDGTLSNHYSAALEAMFGSSRLAGRGLLGILEPIIPEGPRANLQDFLDLAWDPSHSWRHVERLNPLQELTAFIDDGKGGFIEKYLSFSFKRVIKQGQVTRLLVLVTDGTQAHELSEQIEQDREKTRLEMEMLHKVLHLEPDVLLEYITDVMADSDAINEQFREGTGTMGSRLAQVFRITHTIKGNSQLLGLDFIAEKAEAMEQHLQTLVGKDETQGEEFLSLTLLYSDLASSIANLNEIIKKWTRLTSADLGKTGSPKGYSLEEALTEMVGRLASRYQKEMEITFSNCDQLYASLEGEKKKAVRDILIQFVRNSIYHGLEDAKERTRLGKPHRGVIQITGQATPQGHMFTVRDDGRGLDLDLIKSKVREQGLASEEALSSMASKDLITFLFYEGFSTATQADDIAGKGIGMSLVHRTAKSLGGRITIKFSKGQYSAFSLIIPQGTKHG